MIVSFPSHFCTWFSMPLSRVMTFYQRKKSAKCGFFIRVLWAEEDCLHVQTALTQKASIALLPLKAAFLHWMLKSQLHPPAPTSLLRRVFVKCWVWTHLCFSVICCGLIKLFTQLERDLCIFEGTFCFDGYHITIDANSYIGLGHTSHFPGSKPHTCK